MSGVSEIREHLGRVPKPVWPSLALAFAIAFPFIFSEPLASILGDDNDTILNIAIQSLAFAIMAMGLNIVVGFAGLLDLGYVAFYAIGAFVFGWLGSQHFSDVDGGKGIHFLTKSVGGLSGAEIPGIHINFFVVVFIAAAVTALWGVILGAPTLRLRGDYLAIVTLAFGEIVRSSRTRSATCSASDQRTSPRA